MFDNDVCVHECVHCELAYVCYVCAGTNVFVVCVCVCGFIFMCIMMGMYGCVWVEKDVGDKVC